MNFCRNCGRALEPAAQQQNSMPSPADVVRGRPTPPPGAGQAHAPRAPRPCQFCGASTEPGFAFCQQCGKPIEDPARAPTLANTGGHPAQPAPATGQAAPPAPASPPAVGAPAPQHTSPAPVPQPHAGAPVAAPVSSPNVAPSAQGGPTNGSGAGSTTAVRGSAPGNNAASAPGNNAGSAPGSGSQGAQDVQAAWSRPYMPPIADDASAGTSWGTLVSVNRDGVDGKSYPLRGNFVEVGSAAQMCFEDRYLARAHVRLELVEGQPMVTPLDAFNGTYVRLRGEREIVDGDCILVGRELLRFEVVDSSEQDVVQLVQHGVALFGSPVRKTWGRICELLPNGAVRDIRHLAGNEVVIGREEGDIVFQDDEFMSRKHASLQPRSGHFVIADLESSNGTFLRLRERTALDSGDILRLGDQMFRFEPA